MKITNMFLLAIGLNVILLSADVEENYEGSSVFSTTGSK